MELKQLLEQKYSFYNCVDFIENDPVSVPHLFTKKEDIEISGFLTALISWGRRDMIIKTSRQLMRLMDDAPFDFVMHHQAADLHKLKGFVYRTFNEDDVSFLIHALKDVYSSGSGLEEIASNGYSEQNDVKGSILGIRNSLLETPHLARCKKHLANPAKGSAAKRINMFLRWMVRKDEAGVDFGIWKDIPVSGLKCPLDVHSGRVARKLGLLERRQNDWKAVEELTENLRAFDPEDPVKYDYALFGMGVFEGRPD
jgi:uncharacterized protein (TIGR02757 family)